jgi:hypothetical protein
MFSSSVRRVALTVPQAPFTPSLTSSAPRAVATQVLSYRCHQRRSSSSKPSNPADGSKGVAEGETVPTHTQARPAGEKKSSRTNKRKAKEAASSYATKGRDQEFQSLPSVPSTQHIAPQRMFRGIPCSLCASNDLSTEIYASAFFSLHRPISLTSSFPKAITDDAFAAIFTPRTRANPKASEVISTLSSTVHNLESATGGVSRLNLGTQHDQWNSEADELRAAITAESYRKAEVHHVDGSSDLPMNFSQLSLSANHQPFNPPPPPIPLNTAESLAAGAEAAQAQESQHRTYTAVLTIEESTDQHGQVTYLTHSTPLEESAPQPTGFRERMNLRQGRYWEQLEEENGMVALSVKRIRKLKMKKHKYKKFMKRTRNLRRRLDRN